MKIKERLKKEIDVILSSDGYTTYDELSEAFNVSNATARLDMEEVKNFLKSYDLSLESKRGVGLKIVGDDKAIANLKSAIALKTRKLDDLSLQILLYLAKNPNKFVTTKEIGSHLNISDSSISKRLRTINRFLDKYKCDVVSVKNKGILLTGEEDGLRKLLIDYTINFVSEQPLKKKEDTATQILNILKIDASEIFNAIELAQDHLKVRLSDESYNALAIHIAIAIVRIRKGLTTDVPLRSDKDKFKDEYEAACLIADHIDKAYDINMDDNEIYYLFLHLMAIHILKSDNVASVDDSDVKANVICKDIVSLVENIKQVTVEQKYVNNLLIHLRPMINRLEYGIEMQNPLLEQIKMRYPESYGIAWMCNQIFLKECHKAMSEDEAGYLSIHIQTMLESTHSKINVVVVCSSGVGISQLLATQIEQKFNNINIIDVCGLEQFKSSKYDDLQLVISSIHLETTYPLIIVSPILDQANIMEITNFVSGFKSESQQKLEIFGRAKRMFSSQEELIDFVGKDLMSKGIVTSGFMESVLKREKINSTSIGMGIALPHGDFETILRPMFYVVTLIKPIKWGEDMVDLVAFPLVNEKSKTWVVPQLNQIYRKLLVKEIHDQIIQQDDYKDIGRILR